MLKKMDKWLLLLTAVLFMFGLVMIFSASNVAAFMRYSASPYRFLYKQLVILAVSFLVSFIVIRINTKAYSALSWPGIVFIIILLGVVLVYGKTTNHATSWFKIGPFLFQPSEFLKVLMIVWMASFYEVNRNHLDSYATGLVPLLVCGVAAVLIMLQPDLGTAIIYGSISMFIFFISPVSSNIKNKTILISIGAAFLVVVALVGSGKSLISERQMARLNVYGASPCSESKFYSDGNQVCNAYIAVNNGGLFGKGLGNSTQKYLYLPEAHTDFIFAIVLEECGLLMGIGIILLLMLTLARIVVIGRHAVNNRGAIICYGVAFYIFAHIIVNLMGIFGLIPMTGVPLPFISYGGSFTLCLVIALTLVQRVAIETKLFEEKNVL